MRKIYYVVVAVIVFLIGSCSGSKNIVQKRTDKLTGKWFVEYAGIDNISGKNSSSGELLTKDILNGAYLILNTNSTFELNISGQKRTGKWNVSDDGQNLILQDYQKEDKFLISNLEKKKVVLKRNFEQNDYSLILSVH